MKSQPICYIELVLKGTKIKNKMKYQHPFIDRQRFKKIIYSADKLLAFLATTHIIYFTNFQEINI